MKTIENKRIDKSILLQIELLLKNENNEIVRKTLPQVKFDLFRIWGTLNDITQIKILSMIPETWNDFKELLKTHQTEDNVA